MISHRYDAINRLIDTRQPACGTTTVIAVDGPSGAGKTSLADGLAASIGADVLHLEDLYPGWHGLDRTPAVVADLLAAIAVDEIGTATRWDWEHDRPGATMRVRPGGRLILDGVGSGAAIIRPHLSVLLWVEAPTAIRKERALARDGGTYAPFWDVWAAQETRHFTVQATRRHVDLVVST